MIDLRSVRDEGALELFREALRDLTIRVPLAGFSLLGESVQIVEEEACTTLATDGRTIWYAPSWMRKKDLKNRIFDILHEWIHIFMNHPLRCGDRDERNWGIAIDIIVIMECMALLGNEFSIPEDGVQVPPWAKDKTAEEVYELLQNGGKSTQLGSVDGLPSASDIRYVSAKAKTDEEEEAFFNQFRSELAQAHAIMEAAMPHKLPASLKSRLDEILKDSIDWGSVLKGKLLADFGGPVPTYVPPNRRFLGQQYVGGEPIILPSYRSTKEQSLLIGVDVSASVGKMLMDKFIANVMPAAMRAASTTVVTFDEVLRERVTTNNPRALMSQLNFESGMHRTTDARPVFTIADEIRPSALVILTDAWVHYPETPYHQTHWVVPLNGGTPPWGRVHTMQVSW